MTELADRERTRIMANILPFARAQTAAMPEQMRPIATDLPDCASDGEHWAQLMLQAQDGDRAAYHVLLQAVTPYLRAITRRYLGPCEDAEDALQDVLMVVHRIRHTYERGRPFKPWLSTIASRRCIDLLRRRAHRLQHEIETEQELDEYPQAALGPEEATSREHAAGTLRRAVASLPERQREAIHLLRLNELSLDEAAAQSDQSVGSLKVACHRALKSLQRALAKMSQPHD
jgi:RNA polymerase sigma factor (sigma-70 family)